jgi:hypothetical protein
VVLTPARRTNFGNTAVSEDQNCWLRIRLAVTLVFVKDGGFKVVSVWEELL